MELLKRRILQDGKCYPGGILKVDSFINHQMDPNLMMELARELARIYAGRAINKIVTIEASGIAPAIMTGYLMQLPVVFIKKKQPKTMERMLSATVHSFTKGRDYTVCISADFLTPADRVLFVDDFLANGNAAKGRGAHRGHGLPHREGIPARRRPAPLPWHRLHRPGHRQEPRRLPHRAGVMAYATQILLHGKALDYLHRTPRYIKNTLRKAFH